MKRAFSLVELSIVLVILGLLVGGVLAGKSLIHASELRSVSRDFQKYQTATYTFRDKYFYFPGDIPNATQFWGAADGDDGTDSSGAACTTVVSTTAATCNGNGDGTLVQLNEPFRLWQHLANAGLIEGQYSGAQDTVTGVSPAYFNVGLNGPRSSISRAGFVLWSYGGPTGLQFRTAAALGEIFSGNFFIFMRPLPAAAGGGPATQILLGALSHEDAWNIDTKMDDGVAESGKVRGSIFKATGAGNITNMTCATYDLANTTNTCALGFIFGQ
ncbi:MAG: prepilin-type N-terminal cleavage/methylation domain-containing protein [Pseudomonadota bacterium]